MLHDLARRHIGFAADEVRRHDDGEFVGKDALLQRMEAGPTRRLATLVINTNDAPAHGVASVRANGRIVGTVTSGGWGCRTNLNLAYALLEPDLAVPGSEMTVDIIGEPVPARVIESGPYDPGNARVKA